MGTGKTDTEEILEALSPLERKIIPHLNLSIEEIQEKTGLDVTSVLRALRFLESKNFLNLRVIKKKIVELGTNGVLYKKNHFPERRLLDALSLHKALSLEDAQKQAKLLDNEFRVSLGVLKGKALIELKSGKIFLTAKKEEISKKSLEELLVEQLPLDEMELSDEQKFALDKLKKRKDIIEMSERNEITFELTSLGKNFAGKNVESDLIEEVTPEIIKNWKKNKKFRKYDLSFGVPKITGGRRHFVSEAVQRGKRIWLDMGFKEMTGNKTVTSFWNFDALFTAQDHPVREMQDTFFIKDVEGKLPSKELISRVKKSHEGGFVGSKGWGYQWNEELAKKVLLRAHTTCLSSKTISQLNSKDVPGKYFAIGRNFRNETVDWSHGFEFNQSEGIVIDPDANLRHLIGYLQEFYKKMGFEKIRIQPSYFPYTEPSLEIYAYHPERKLWLELGGAGIFRPEVTAPLFGKPITVLAWGPGFDRLMIMSAGISDLRDVYKNDLKYLRTRKVGAI